MLEGVIQPSESESVSESSDSNDSCSVATSGSSSVRLGSSALDEGFSFSCSDSNDYSCNALFKFQSDKTHLIKVKVEMEFVDHLSLEKYLSDSSAQKQFNDEAKKTSFLLEKFAFCKQDRVDDM